MCDHSEIYYRTNDMFLSSSYSRAISNIVRAVNNDGLIILRRDRDENGRK